MMIINCRPYPQSKIQQDNIDVLSRDSHLNIGTIAKELKQDNGSYVNKGFAE